MLIGEAAEEANGSKEKSLFCKNEIEKIISRENPHILTYQAGRWAALEHFYDSPMC